MLTGRARIWLSAAVRTAPGVTGGGRVPPGDEPVRADDDRAVAGDLPVALPGAARIVVVAVEVADPQRVERDVRLRGELTTEALWVPMSGLDIAVV